MLCFTIGLQFKSIGPYRDEFCSPYVKEPQNINSIFTDAHGIFTDTTTPKPGPNTTFEYKIFSIFIESGKKVLKVKDQDTKLSLKICAKHTHKDQCCKTEEMYSKYYTQPNQVARFNNERQLGTCHRFLVGVNAIKDPFDSVEVSYKSSDEKTEFDAKKIWICLTSDGKRHHMLECSGISSFGPESMTTDIVSKCMLQRKKTCLMLQKRSRNQ